jgi:Txe/YoeB family toxin of toxin-antitoxin system
MAYQMYFTRQALNDWETLKKQGNSNLMERAQLLLKLIGEKPFATYPPYKKLTGELSGLYARRLNLQHRLVYQVIEESKAVKVVSMWT